MTHQFEFGDRFRQPYERQLRAPARAASSVSWRASGMGCSEVKMPPSEKAEADVSAKLFSPFVAQTKTTSRHPTSPSPKRGAPHSISTCALHYAPSSAPSRGLWAGLRVLPHGDHTGKFGRMRRRFSLPTGPTSFQFSIRSPESSSAKRSTGLLGLPFWH